MQGGGGRIIFTSATATYAGQVINQPNSFPSGSESAEWQTPGS